MYGYFFYQDGKLRFSRHARNNMRLYGITEDDVIKTLNSPDSTNTENDRIVALKRFKDKFSGYPLKIVYVETSDEPTIVTAYPLKKKYWR